MLINKAASLRKFELNRKMISKMLDFQKIFNKAKLEDRIWRDCNGCYYSAINKVQAGMVKIFAIFLSLHYCRAQRERNNRVTYSTNKCLYDLPPFDQHFDPLVHNKYLSRWDPPHQPGFDIKENILGKQNYQNDKPGEKKNHQALRSF